VAGRGVCMSDPRDIGKRKADSLSLIPSSTMPRECELRRKKRGGERADGK